MTKALLKERVLYWDIEGILTAFCRINKNPALSSEIHFRFLPNGLQRLVQITNSLRAADKRAETAWTRQMFALGKVIGLRRRKRRPSAVRAAENQWRRYGAASSAEHAKFYALINAHRPLTKALCISTPSHGLCASLNVGSTKKEFRAYLDFIEMYRQVDLPYIRQRIGIPRWKLEELLAKADALNKGNKNNPPIKQKEAYRIAAKQLGIPVGPERIRQWRRVDDAKLTF